MQSLSEQAELVIMIALQQEQEVDHLPLDILLLAGQVVQVDLEKAQAVQVDLAVVAILAEQVAQMVVQEAQVVVIQEELDKVLQQENSLKQELPYIHLEQKEILHILHQPIQDMAEGKTVLEQVELLL